MTLHPLETAAVGLGGLAESLVFSTTAQLLSRY